MVVLGACLKEMYASKLFWEKKKKKKNLIIQHKNNVKQDFK